MNHGDPRLDRLALKRASSYHVQDPQTRHDLQPNRARSQSRAGNHGVPRAQRLTSKNITMRIDPAAHDWTNFTINQVKTTKLHTQKQPKSSISPFTNMQAPVQLAPAPYAQAPSNVSRHSRDMRSQSRDSYTVSRTNSLSKVNTLARNGSEPSFELVSKANLSLESIHPGKPQTKSENLGSMFSAVPATKSDSDVESADRQDDVKLPFLEESDNSDVYDDFQDIGQDFENVTSVLDFMNQIEKPKADAQAFRATRTQQKLDDLKSLLGDPEAEPAKTGMDYSVRIQSESLSSQWSQIRLRFSNYLHYGRGKKAEKVAVECRAGVLGSVKRLQGLEIGPVLQTLVSKDHAQEYLRELWNSGLASEPRVALQGVAIPGHSQTLIVAGSDGDIYQDRGFNVSRLAKNVMFSRDLEESKWA